MGKDLFLLEGCCVRQIIGGTLIDELNHINVKARDRWIECYGPMLKQFVQQSNDGLIIISDPRLFRNAEDVVVPEYESLRNELVVYLRQSISASQAEFKLVDPYESASVEDINQRIPGAGSFYNRNFAVFYNWSSEAQFRSDKQDIFERRIANGMPTDIGMLLGLKITSNNGETGDLFFSTVDESQTVQPSLWQRENQSSPPQLLLKSSEDFNNYRMLTDIVSQLNSFTLSCRGWSYQQTVIKGL